VQFNSPRFLSGLARAIAREGGRIHCGVRAKAVLAGQPASLLTTAGHRIDAATIVTPHPPRADGNLDTRPVTRMAHVVGLRVARGTIPRALYWDSSHPARCARLRHHGGGASEVLLVGGEDPPGPVQHDNDRYEALEKWARERFPETGEVVQHFSGQITQTLDVFAYTAQAHSEAESLYVSTGDWGTATTRGALAGLVIRDFTTTLRLARVAQPA